MIPNLFKSAPAFPMLLLVPGCADNLMITTVAGNGSDGYSNGASWNGGTVGVAKTASLGLSAGTATDAEGNLFIADYSNCRIRKVDVAGLITDFAGNGTCALGGDGGAATAATINHPRDVALDSNGAVYIADTDNCLVRKVFKGTISTVAGTTCGFSGDGAPATAAKLGAIESIAIDPANNIVIADTGNNRVRRVTSDGKIATIAGNGSDTWSGDGGPATAAGMRPEAVAVSLFGNIVIADTNNQRVRMFIPGGNVSTIAGTGVAGYSGDAGDATSARIDTPLDVAVDSLGTLFIADTFNCRVRKVTATSVISTLAGTGTCGDTGENGNARVAQLSWVSGISVDRSGSVLATSGNKVKAVLGAANPTYPSIDAALTTRFRNYGDTNNATHTNWSGGDGAYSIKLPDNRIAWFFSDSYLGHVNTDHQRANPGFHFINNQAVLQDTAGVLTNVFSGAAGTSFFPTAPNGDVYWPQASNVNGSTLQVLLRRANLSGVTGVALATITLPAFTLGPIVDISARAFVTTGDCPDPKHPVTFGNAITYDGTSTYIYGVEGCPAVWSAYAYVAKVTGTDLSSPWTYFTGTPDAPSWGAAGAAARLQKTDGTTLVEAGYESSVVKVGSTYRMITSPLSINPEIYRSTSPTAYGPWSQPTLVFIAPEYGQLDWGPGATCTHFTYNSKEHAAYATTGKIVLSYNMIPSTCAGGPTDLLTNVDNYRPRFIDIAD